MQCQYVNMMFINCFIAIAIAFDSTTYDIKEQDKKAVVTFSVQSGEITTPLTVT